MEENVSKICVSDVRSINTEVIPVLRGREGGERERRILKILFRFPRHGFASRISSRRNDERTFSPIVLKRINAACKVSLPLEFNKVRARAVRFNYSPIARESTDQIYIYIYVHTERTREIRISSINYLKEESYSFSLIYFETNLNISTVNTVGTDTWRDQNSRDKAKRR